MSASGSVPGQSAAEGVETTVMGADSRVDVDGGDMTGTLHSAQADPQRSCGRGIYSSAGGAYPPKNPTNFRKPNDFAS